MILSLRLLRALLSSLLLLLALSGDALRADGAAPTLDHRIVLRIGTYELSGYLIDKYHRRFSDAEHQRLGRPPEQAAHREWLELFLAQQLIVAHAESQGYGARPEVRRIVDQMERHMLTQPEGPFYQTLYSHEPIDDDRLRRLHERSQIVRQVVLVRFNDETTALSALGADFTRQTDEEKLRRIKTCRDRGDALVHDGAIAWPFEPFSEIGDLLDKTSAGEWIEHRDPLFGIYRGYVREMNTQPGPALDAIRTQFEAMVQRVDRQKIQRRRRAELLAAADFRLQTATAERVVERIRTLSPATPQIPETLLAALASEPLFSYRIANNGVTVTVETYRQQFNDRLIRRLPGMLRLLRLDTENMVVEELDFQAACAQGIPNSLQFAEDRAGFRRMQILDLLEKEMLLPSIQIEPGEIESYYRGHTAEFQRTSRIAGRLFTFESEEMLKAWQRQPSPNAHGENLEVSSAHPLAGFEAFHTNLMQAPPGVPFGPVKRADGYAVFIKEKNVAIEPLPLAEARPLIHAKLQRRHLDEKERQLAAELTRQFQIEDQIDYIRYGLDREELRLPWHNSQRL
jgi:hypothetical protein